MQRIDRYELVAPMAVEDGVKVWSARDPLHHDAEVILHVVDLRDENAPIVARLRREALAISESGEVEVHISEDPKRGIFCVAYRTETVDPSTELALGDEASSGAAPARRLPVAAVRGPSFISLWLIAGGALLAMAVAIVAAVMLTSAEGAVEHKSSRGAEAPGSPDDTTIYIDLVPAESAGAPSSNASHPVAPAASSFAR